MAVMIVVHGPSGSGKTTLIEELLSRFVARGLKVGVIKHTHKGFSLDQQGKDSQRFWEAGAHAVLVAGPDELFVRQRRSHASLHELLGLLPQGLDCVFVEGFARAVEGVDGAIALRMPVDVDEAEAAIASRLITPRPAVGPKGPARRADPPSADTAGRGVTVTVLPCAQLADRLGDEALRVSLPSGATGAQLMRWLAERHPTIDGLLAVSRLAIQCEYVSLDHTLQDGDEAVLIPPVSGG